MTDKPVFAIAVNVDHVSTLLTDIDDVGVVEAAELRVMKFDEGQPCTTRAAAEQLLRAMEGLARELGIDNEVGT